MIKLKYSKKYYLMLREQPLAGTSFVNWMKLLIDNKFNINWRFLPKAIYVTSMISLTYPLRRTELSKFDEKIKNTKNALPIFIIGHWRSGTTFLNYLMGQDEAFSYVSTLDTMAPYLFMRNEKFLKKILDNALPDKRPMDDLELKTNLPYEEEYAIANLCPYSFYHSWYFPKKLYDYFKKYVLFEGVTNDVIKEWQNAYIYLLKKITYKYKKKRILLKSLVNTAKIKYLMEVFPDAKFIHIYRNPYKVYLSTWKLYNNIFPIFSFQHINEKDLDFSIINIYRQMYKKFFMDKTLIPKENLIEIRYENFVKKPLETLNNIYSDLKIDGFSKAKPAFEKYIKMHKNYKPANFSYSEQIKEKIYREWGFAFKELRYDR